MYPLVLAMDYEARPKWCPRWFLRFLYVFGSDKSVVRVRNFRLHNLEKKLNEYEFLKRQIETLKAKYEGVYEVIKQVGKEKFIELYIKNRSNPNSFLIKDGDGCTFNAIANVS